MDNLLGLDNRVDKLIKKRLVPACPAGIEFRLGRRKRFSIGLKFKQKLKYEAPRLITPIAIMRSFLKLFFEVYAKAYVAIEGIKLLPTPQDNSSQAGIVVTTLKK